MEVLMSGKKKEETLKDPGDFEGATILKEPGQGMEMWKPKEKGQNITGKLLKISQIRFGSILRISTEFEGVVTVPVSTFLEDIDFEKYIGQIVSLTFEGIAGRGCKLFTVSVLEPKF